MADATAQAKETQKKNAELKQKSVEEAYGRQGKPTPTQEECDLAVLGVPIEEHEDDGSGPSPEFKLVNTADVKTRSPRRSKPLGGGNYQTRAHATGPKENQRTEAVAKLTMARFLTRSAEAAKLTMANEMTDKPRYRVKAGSAALVTKAEGEVHPGPYYLPVTGGWLPANSPWNWWQDGTIPDTGFDSSAMVEACLSAYSQTIAMCPGDHWRLNEKAGRDRVTTSALSRILRHPNSYQSPSDFMLNLTRSLYADGNAYALALRNDRYEIDELHLMDPRMCNARKSPRPATCSTGSAATA